VLYETFRRVVLHELSRDLMTRDVLLMLLKVLLNNMSDDRENFVLFPSRFQERVFLRSHDQCLSRVGDTDNDTNHLP
jgi:hypothetical protein